MVNEELACGVVTVGLDPFILAMGHLTSGRRVPVKVYKTRVDVRELSNVPSLRTLSHSAPNAVTSTPNNTTSQPTLGA